MSEEKELRGGNREGRREMRGMEAEGAGGAGGAGGAEKGRRLGGKICFKADYMIGFVCSVGGGGLR